MSEDRRSPFQFGDEVKVLSGLRAGYLGVIQDGELRKDGSNRFMFLVEAKYPEQKTLVDGHYWEEHLARVREADKIPPPAPKHAKGRLARFFDGLLDL